MKLKALPVQQVKFSKMNTGSDIDYSPPEDGIDNKQFTSSRVEATDLYNSIRNTTVRGYHKDDGSDKFQGLKIGKPPKLKRSSAMTIFDDNAVLDREVRNKYDRGFNQRGAGLNEYQQDKKRTLRWNPMTDFDDAGNPGIVSGISTEQGDPLIDIKKDAIQGIKNPVEPYVSARKFQGVRLKSLKK